jgi:predicted transcriptional regulator
MRVKKIKVGIKGVKEVLEDFVRAGEAIEKGEEVKKEVGIYFESIEAFRKALTPKRLELIHLIKEHSPQSIHELSKLGERDIKNVADDVELLTNLGLVEVRRRKEGRKEIAPKVKYDVIELRIAV